MGDYVQKKGLGQGFNLIYVSAICLGGNLNKKSFSFCNGKSPDYLLFWLYCISFLHDLWISWHEMAKKSSNNERKKYNIAKMEIILTISIAKRIFFIQVSSKTYFGHIYQIEALAKTFLLNIVSHSVIFGCVLRLQQSSVQGII